MTDQQFYKQCLAQEKKYTFPSLKRSDIWELGNCLVKAAGKASGPLAVTIRINDTEVFRYYPEGTGLLHEQWLQRKYNTVKTMNMASMTYKAKLAAEGYPQDDDGLYFPEYAACGGGFPIRLKGGLVIGFIGMSGLSDDEDHAAILAGLDLYFKKK